MSYNLSFEIDPGLYRRALTVPMIGAPNRAQVVWRNLMAAVLASLSCLGVALAFFNVEAFLPLFFGVFWGAALVLAVWWRQHNSLVKIHTIYNDTGGTQKLRISSKGILVSRVHIRSEIDWCYVQAIRGIDGASLIELPTARLIVPDAALPDGESQNTFITRLEKWRV